MKKASSLTNWTPEEIALGKMWVATWRQAGTALDAIRQRELRELDAYKAIELLCGQADYTVSPRAPRLTSGLVEQQRLFKKAVGSE